MEPSYNIISINKEIKFKKADFERALKDPEECYLISDFYRPSTLHDVRYYISIYPNGHVRKKRGQALIFFCACKNDATVLDVDIDCFIESASFSTNIKSKCSKLFGSRSFISTTSELFDPANNFFNDDDMVVKIKGTLKISFPPRTLYPISAVWKIQERDLQNAITAQRLLESNKFKISSDSDVKYSIVINCEEQVHLFFHLQVGTCTSKVKAMIKFSIDSAFYEKTGDFFQEICSTEELFDPERYFFVNRVLILKVSGAVVVETGNVVPTILALENGIVPKGYHRNRNFTFIIDERTFKVHKHVLKDASPVFQAMFESKMKEVIEKKMDVVDFEYEVVHAAMRLLYSASLPTTFTFEQMLQLLKFSDKYAIELIKNPVQEYLIQRISSTNVCAIIKFTSTMINTSVLHTQAVEYLVKRLEEKKAVHDMDLLEKDFVFKMLMRITAQVL